MCPLPLFFDIIKINYIRSRAASLGSGATGLVEEAHEVLAHIQSFSPVAWASSKTLSQDDWMLMGNIYKEAVALYCILSLQSVSVLPLTSHLDAESLAHSQHLQKFLQSALTSPQLKWPMIWPLVVLGVGSAHADVTMRRFVMNQLPQLSRSIGTSTPLTAARILSKFWDSNEVRWDVCFNESHMFTAQIAVDTSPLLSQLNYNEG
jgi:hypothetical protein